MMIQKSYEYTTADWLKLHGVTATMVCDVLSLLPFTICRTKRYEESRDIPDTKLTAEQAWDLAAQALTEFFPKLLENIIQTHSSCEKVFNASENKLPYTLDRGLGKPPVVSLCYRGTPADVVCVAHEFGHALQYFLAQGRFIPPVMRELAAFVSERALLEFVHQQNPELHALLYKAWQCDSKIYLGKDAMQLDAAMQELTTPYYYRLNYPLARFFSIELANVNSTEVFRGNTSVPVNLSIIRNGVS